ncbi:MAG: hypothetical protein JO221_02340 [Sphingomonas sp.]|nr:hypothetical protein [Sphingomonas sp.]
MKRIMAVALVAALVGCKGPAREQPREAAHVEDHSANVANAAAPASGHEVTESATSLPSAFHGRWGLVQADCTSTNGDNKGLMTVEAGRLTFYESRATVAQVETVSPTAVKARLEFTGEGQTWQQDTPLTLEDQGKTLTRVADGQTLRYTRCGA